MRLIQYAILLCLFVASAAFAEGAALLGVPDRAVRTGEQVTLEWRGLPADAREVELELSLDGGRWIRISPELEALEGRWTWTVPSLNAESARIRLRFGRDHEEFVAAVSGGFRIDGAALSAERRRDHAGEWWQALARQASPAGTAFGFASAELAPLERTASADLPTSPSLGEPGNAGIGAAPRAPLTLTRPNLPQRCARPGFVPLRN